MVSGKRRCLLSSLHSTPVRCWLHSLLNNLLSYPPSRLLSSLVSCQLDSLLLRTRLNHIRSSLVSCWLDLRIRCQLNHLLGSLVSCQANFLVNSRRRSQLIHLLSSLVSCQLKSMLLTSQLNPMLSSLVN